MYGLTIKHHHQDQYTQAFFTYTNYNKQLSTHNIKKKLMFKVHVQDEIPNSFSPLPTKLINLKSNQNMAYKT